MEIVGEVAKKARKPGRPRAIPVEMERVVVELYREGYGYRAIARILRKEHGLNPHYSSVRKTLVRLGEVRRQ
jgi:transposase